MKIKVQKLIKHKISYPGRTQKLVFSLILCPPETHWTYHQIIFLCLILPVFPCHHQKLTPCLSAQLSLTDALVVHHNNDDAVLWPLKMSLRDVLNCVLC